jgi:hypothetical protein
LEERMAVLQSALEHEELRPSAAGGGMTAGGSEALFIERLEVDLLGPADDTGLIHQRISRAGCACLYN